MVCSLMDRKLAWIKSTKLNKAGVDAASIWVIIIVARSIDFLFLAALTEALEPEGAGAVSGKASR